MSTAQMAMVSLPKLIAAIEARRVERVKEYEKQVKEYEIAGEKWRKDAVKRLEQITLRVAGGTFDDLQDEWSGRFTVHLTSMPSKPREPDFEQLDRDLASLKLMVDDSIKLKTDSNFFRYL